MGVVAMMLAQGAAASGSTAVTWNPSDKSSLITLSGSDLVATRTGATDSYGTVRATLARPASSTGGYYFEVVVTNASSSIYVVIGVANASQSLSDYVGNSTYGWSYYQETGGKISSGTQTAYGASYTTGDVIGVLLKNGKLYFRKNGTWQNSADVAAETGAAFTGLTGDLYPAVSMFRSTSPVHVLTGRFKASAFSGSIPSGASAWEA